MEWLVMDGMGIQKVLKAEISALHTCAFTGHRPRYFSYAYDELHPHCAALKDAIRERVEHLIILHGVRRFLSGGAMGVDIWCAEIIADFIERGFDLQLEFAVPFPNHTSGWRKEEELRYKLRYQELLKYAEKVHVTSRRYFKSQNENVYMIRNQFMVDESQYLISVWNREPSGTGNTVRYAEAQRRSRILIHPETLDIEEIYYYITEP